MFFGRPDILDFGGLDGPGGPSRTCHKVGGSALNLLESLARFFGVYF